MFNQFINTFIDAQTAAWRQYRSVAAIEKLLFGESVEPVVRVPATGEITAELRRVYRALAQRMVELARKQFARGSARLVVNLASIGDSADFDIERSLARGEVPDFDRLWATLETHFGALRAASEDES
jgi:hypothetical protein